MTKAHFGSAAWRRLLLATITALIAIMALSFSAPERADAFIDPNIVLVNHIGWVKTAPLVACMSASGNACEHPMHQAWRWTGSKWTSVQLDQDIDVYAYPYSGSWSWVWTQRAGWLAIQRGELVTGYHCSGYACPMF